MIKMFDRTFDIWYCLIKLNIASALHARIFHILVLRPENYNSTRFNKAINYFQFGPSILNGHLSCPWD